VLIAAPFQGDAAMTLQLVSSAFQEGQLIPKRYTADGEDVSPPLTWSDPPKETKSFVLICDDPDAPRGTWVHWVLFNLPPQLRELKEAVPAEGTLASGARQGNNDFGNLGYGGPAPPRGKPHRYFFKLYALDCMLDLKAGVSKEQVMTACKEHILADGQWMGNYQR
jgi:Raf kinase inhibitor-like YbhB/YbcL family protein